MQTFSALKLGDNIRNDENKFVEKAEKKKKEKIQTVEKTRFLYVRKTNWNPIFVVLFLVFICLNGTSHFTINSIAHAECNDCGFIQVV